MSKAPAASGSNAAFNDKVRTSLLERNFNVHRREQGKPMEVRLSNMTAAKGGPLLYRSTHSDIA